MTHTFQSFFEQRYGRSRALSACQPDVATSQMLAGFADVIQACLDSPHEWEGLLVSGVEPGDAEDTCDAYFASLGMVGGPTPVRGSRATVKVYGPQDIRDTSHGYRCVLSEVLGSTFVVIRVCPIQVVGS